jgi:uncharacterized membrane protein
VLEINVPEDEFENLWKRIADQWPSYLGYVTSFLTVGGLRLIHHGIFRRLASADARVMLANLLHCVGVDTEREARVAVWPSWAIT